VLQAGDRSWVKTDLEMNLHSDSNSIPDQAALLVPPAGSRIQIVENSPERLTLVFPPAKGRLDSNDYFVLGWWGILGLLTAVWVGGVRPKPAPDDSPEVTPLVLTVFWIIAIGMAVARLRSRSRTILLSIDRTRCVLRTILFGRTSTTEIPVTDDTLADVRLPKEDGDARSDVQIGGHGRDLQVPAVLSVAEQVWLIGQINAFLHGPETAASLRCRGSAVTSNPGWSPVPSAELLANSPIGLREDSPQRLRLELADFPNRTGRWLCTAGVLTVAGFGLRSQIRERLAEVPGWGAMLPWTIAFHVVCWILGVATFAFVIWRKTFIDLTPEELQLRIGVGWLFETTKLPTLQIRGVVVSRCHKLPMVRELDANHPDALQDGTTDCLVVGEQSRVVVAKNRSLVIARQVAGLLVAKLASWKRNVDFREESR
jgi:hypothetical protein